MLSLRSFARALRQRLGSAYFKASVSSTSRTVRDLGYTFLTYRKLWVLEEAVRDIEQRGCPGDLLEAGVARGGSAIVLMNASDSRRGYRGYDVFSRIPPPSSKDSEDAHRRYDVIESGEAEGVGGHTYYGYEENLFQLVCGNLAEFGYRVDGEKIALISGLFQDTLSVSADEEIALAHIDCDWYESVAYVLDEIAPAISGHGLVIVDDYNDFDGARKATEEFLADNSSMKLIRDSPSAVIRRNGNRETPLSLGGDA